MVMRPDRPAFRFGIDRHVGSGSTGMSVRIDRHAGSGSTDTSVRGSNGIGSGRMTMRPYANKKPGGERMLADPGIPADPGAMNCAPTQQKSCLFRQRGEGSGLAHRHSRGLA